VIPLSQVAKSVSDCICHLAKSVLSSVILAANNSIIALIIKPINKINKANIETTTQKILFE